MTRLMVLALALAFCFVGGASASKTYEQTDFWNDWGFFDNFDFYSKSDPTHGYVYYATKQQCYDWDYVSANSKGQVTMRADDTTVSTGSGRGSVRIQSKKRWDVGTHSYLYVLDLEHMPTGCGTWPAWWMVGPNWPNGGEIDIIEGVNVHTANQVSLHTGNNCNMNHDSSSQFTGNMGNKNCAYQPGCGISNTGSYGSKLNNEKGGVYAMEWNQTSIAVWYFSRGHIPSDLEAGSKKASTGHWGKPAAFFPFGGDCTSSHFYSQQMIFDLTFCGDWAGAVFGSECPGKGSCNSYVKNNPSAFHEAYWLINFVKVMQG